jgi:hypothetical protein
MKEYKEFIEAMKQFHSLQNKVEPHLLEIAKDLKNKLRAAYDELYPNISKYDIPRWFSWGREIRIDYDYFAKIVLEYWELGIGGDNDYCLHEIEMTEDLFTTEGQEAYVQAWRDSEKIKAVDFARNEEDKRLREIAELERKLAQLKINHGTA